MKTDSAKQSVTIRHSDYSFQFRHRPLIVLPFGGLLALYLLVVGGGGAWLYHQVRTVETRLLVDEVTAALEPFAKKLGAVDAASAIEQREPWLIKELQALFAAIPSLRNVSVRGPDTGSQMFVEGGGEVAFRDTSPLPRGSRRAKIDSPEQTRETVDELARDIVSLNEKLSAFLDLTRRHDDDLEQVDIGGLIKDAARLAEPVLAKHGLGIEINMPPGLPQVRVRKASVRDALLNVLINAGQSGQTAGAGSCRKSSPGWGQG